MSGDYRVHCRVGSLESSNGKIHEINKVHCHIGSLEMLDIYHRIDLGCLLAEV